MPITKKTRRKLSPLARRVADAHNEAAKLADFLHTLAVRITDMDHELVALNNGIVLTRSQHSAPGWLRFDAQECMDLITICTLAFSDEQTVAMPKETRLTTACHRLRQRFIANLEAINQCQSQASASPETEQFSSATSSSAQGPG